MLHFAAFIMILFNFILSISQTFTYIPVLQE